MAWWWGLIVLYNLRETMSGIAHPLADPLVTFGPMCNDVLASGTKSARWCGAILGYRYSSYSVFTYDPGGL